MLVTKGRNPELAKKIFQEFLKLFEKIEVDTRCNLDDVKEQKKLLEGIISSS